MTSYIDKIIDAVGAGAEPHALRAMLFTLKEQAEAHDASVEHLEAVLQDKPLQPEIDQLKLKCSSLEKQLSDSQMIIRGLEQQLDGWRNSSSGDDYRDRLSP